MSTHRGGPRPPDPRLARQPDGRGRRAARVAARVGRAAVPSGRVDRRARGGRAARRRRARGAARASRSAVANVNGEIAEAVRGRDARRPGGPRRGADRARRHAEQGPARRERDPRRLARGGEGGRRGGRRLALPPPRRRRRARRSRADDERDQRRRARATTRSTCRSSWSSRSAPTASPRRCGRRRGLPLAQEGARTSAGSRHGVGDEGGFAPDLESSEAAIEAILEAADAAGHRERVAIALDPGDERGLLATASTASRVARSRRPRCRRSGRELIDRYPIVSIEDGARRGRLGGVGSG